LLRGVQYGSDGASRANWGWAAAVVVLVVCQGANQASQEIQEGEAGTGPGLGPARLTTPIAWSKNGRTTKRLGYLGAESEGRDHRN